MPLPIISACGPGRWGRTAVALAVLYASLLLVPPAGAQSPSVKKVDWSKWQVASCTSFLTKGTANAAPSLRAKRLKIVMQKLRGSGRFIENHGPTRRFDGVASTTPDCVPPAPVEFKEGSSGSESVNWPRPWSDDSGFCLQMLNLLGHFKDPLPGVSGTISAVVKQDWRMSIIIHEMIHMNQRSTNPKADVGKREDEAYGAQVQWVCDLIESQHYQLVTIDRQWMEAFKCYLKD